MYGLEAISHANGWAQAFVGASIVLFGLFVLSFLISHLHRLVEFFDKKNEVDDVVVKKEGFVAPKKLPMDMASASEVYLSFTRDLGEKFMLVDLYKLSQKIGLPHPHISIRDFRSAGFLISVGEGYFSWKPVSD